MMTVTLRGQDHIEIFPPDEDGGWRVKAVGCTALLREITALYRVNPNLDQWPLPTGQSHTDFLLREMILKARGEWNYPITSSEICHCRSVATDVVDRVIVNGAETCEVVSARTLASTGCGTCRSDVERLLHYRRLTSAQNSK